MRHPFHFISGFGELETEGRYAARLLDLCRRHSIPYTILSLPDPDTPLRIRTRFPDAKKLLSFGTEEGLPVSLCRTGGLPRLAGVLCSHLGYLAGGAVGLLLLLAAEQVVWDVRVNVGDAETLTAAAVEEELAGAGLVRGAWIPALDGDAIESRLLCGDAPIAWVSVNLTGTVAEVQAVELLPVTPARKKDLANVVAKQDGFIEEVRLVEGKVTVAPGQYVRAGELLISGMDDSPVLGTEYTGTRFYAADGQVMARTRREILIEIPLETTGYCPSGTPEKEIFLLFFGNPLKIFKNSGNCTPICDTIKETVSVRNFTLGEDAALPFAFTRVTRQPLSKVAVRLTPEEAEIRAKEELARQLGELCTDAQLLSCTTVLETGEKSVILRARLTLREDIASRIPIETDGQNEK